MGYRLSNDKFDIYLSELSDRYDIYAPTIMRGKGKFSDTDVVGYGKIEQLSDIVVDRKSYYSPKEIFYPIRETLFYFNGNEFIEPKLDMKPVLILLRPCDLNGIKRLDSIFLKNGNEADYYYLRRRNLVKFAMIECTEGFDTCYCVSMDSNIADEYDMAIRFADDMLLDIADKELITASLNENAIHDFKPDYIKENKIKVTVPPTELVTKEVFDNPIWTEYTARCIACGRCNTSCITCSCYTMQDTKLSDDKKIGERRRVWAGCHVDGFSDMAGGHSFRKKNGERMRFKAMHKINDFNKRFGFHMCVGCGRCDDVCPEYISFSKCINKINQIVMEGNEDE